MTRFMNVNAHLKSNMASRKPSKPLVINVLLRHERPTRKTLNHYTINLCHSNSLALLEYLQKSHTPALKEVIRPKYPQKDNERQSAAFKTPSWTWFIDSY